MPVAVRVNPIAPDRLDEWRDLVAELAGPRRVEWSESHRRRGVTRQVVSTCGPEDRPLSVVLVEAADPERADTLLHSSDDEFDVWLRGRLAELLGPDVPSTVLFDSAPRRGPWRGLRRPGPRP